ncbi:polyprenyl synthetase family protein [Nakamurella sp. YIM 132087]|uniref:Polyprenyl synthetase family protein n=1 Tax=Nakamurella alba TaxID=2665158 RepID=A0A7K1FTD2_9ACTN|nr:polyprenyl synthetase family protein [Nakamurella alba]MTD17381.1 polyprenyl synthetase family protein [Nakamurella alba]
MSATPAADSELGTAARLLHEALAERREAVATIDPRLLPDLDRLLTFVDSGKWLRPRFLLAGHRATGREPDEAVLRAAGSLELIQACALLHDDVIDRSDTRRGDPSTHRAVAKEHADHGWSGDADHYGISVAILLGDLALAWADDIFTAAAADLDALTATLPVWRDMRTEVLAGQLLDLRATADLADAPEAQIADASAINRYKTAAYTVERPLHLGAALAGAGHDTIAALREYGAAIGVAFQLRDDLLGVFGDPAVTGKPAGDDLVEGKRTVLLALAREPLTGTPDLDELDAGIGRSNPPGGIDRLRDLIAATGAPERLESRIAQLHAEGLEALRRTTDGAPVVATSAAADLTDLARRAVFRER